MMPLVLTAETALALLQAGLTIKKMLSDSRPDPTADFTDADAEALAKSRIAEGLGLVAEWRARPTTPGS